MNKESLILSCLLAHFMGGAEVLAANHVGQHFSNTDSTLHNLRDSPYPAVKQALHGYQQGVAPFSHVLKAENQCLIEELETMSSRLTPVQKRSILQQIGRNFDHLIEIAQSIDDSAEIINLKKGKNETLARLIALAYIGLEHS